MRRSRRARYPNDKVETDTFILKGGLNLVDAAIAIPEGMALAATNYELLSRDGYHRVDGYERFDGQAKPSDASYWILDFDAGDVVTPVVDSLVIGATSGATAKVGIVVLESGTWAGSDAAGYLALYTLTGNFIDDEVLNFTGADPSFSHGFSSGFS
jgi:hypothetical protein